VTHLGIGQLLLKQTLPENLDEALFAIVSQFNLGTDCLTSPNDRSQVAHLNLAAARKARLSAAYGAAAQYSEMALQLVTDVWLQQPTFALDLYHEAANSACLIGDFERVDTYIAAIFQQVSNPLDQIKILEVQIQSLIARNRLEEALQVARTILQKLSVTLPEHPTAEMMPSALESIRQQLAGIGDVTDLAPMRDPAKLAAMSILSSMASAAYIGSPALYPLIVLKQIELSLQFGNTLETPYAYATYGLILSAFGGEIAAGNRSADIAIALMEKLQAFRFKSKILNLVYPFTRIWQESIRSTLEPLREGYQAGLESGDLEFAAYCAYNRCKLAYAAGTNLLELQIEMQRYGEVIAQLKQTTALNFHQIGQQAVLNWLGMTTQPQHLIGTAYDETVRLLDHQAAGDVYSIGTFYAHKLILTYHFAQPQEALEIGRIAETKISGIIGTAFYGIFRFYHALTLLANELIPLSDRDLLTADIAEDLGCLEHWAIHAPMNFAHRCDLVRAEQERTLGHHAAAIDLYDRAIAGAKANEYIQEEALANELAAKFYLDWGKEKVAAGYMQEAYYCYARWGAKAKIDDLETRYPQLLRPILQAAAQSLNVFETLASIAAPHPSLHSSTPSSRSSSTSINTALDFAAILKASQSLASTLQLDELLHQLSQLILQNSGGDRSILLLQNPTGEWFVEAVAIPDNTDRCSEPLEGNINVPTQLIQYVKNTQATVTINDGKTELPVVGSYFNQRQPKSVLCLPILNQSQLMGMLYLENQATSGVFTRDRILVLNFLCTQAAISIKNARHYTQAQTSQHQLATLLSNLTGMAYSCQNDANWTMLFVSQGCLEMTGYTPEEFIHNRSVAYASLIHPDDVEFLDDTVQASLAQQCPFQVTYRITTKQGQEKWVWEQGRGVFDANGQFIALEGLITDISDRKQAEAIILQKSQALECALAEVQTTQLQMVQNEKMASLGNLVVGVAHEINNPIGFLNGSINNAKDYVRDLLGHLALYQQHHPNPAAPIQDHAEDIDLEYLSEDLPKLLASMKGATDRIKGISTSLRTFSRADTEYKVSANLHEGLDSTLLILKYRLKGNEHRPEIQVIPQYGDLPAIQCFPGQLNQVFMNILANAIDMFDELAQQFTLADLQANPQILTLQTTLADSNTAEIRIRDNGKGMSEALAARIFDHLFTTKGVGKGTGLGLAIARQIIVEKHGGSLEVQSELGQGSEFYIRLPIHAE
jgi:PAS domain S-box-containing protein